MFFGLEVKSNQNQAKPVTLSNNLHLSQAVLEPKGANGKKEPVSLVAEINKKQFILCVLDPNLSWQCPLDLCFEGGSQVKFFLRGNGTVHLTGYEDYDDLDDMSLSMSSDEEFSADEKVAQPIKTKSSASNGSSKTLTKEVAKTNGVAKKSARLAKKPKIQDMVDDEEEDDDSFDESFNGNIEDLDDDSDVSDLEDEDLDDEDDEGDEDDDDDENEDDDDMDEAMVEDSSDPESDDAM